MKYYIILALVLGGAIGYFLTPTKIITKTEIKEVEKIVKDTEKNKKNDKVVIIVETVLPDGTKRKETKIVDKGTITIDTRETEERSSETRTEKTVEREHDSLLVYGLATAPVSNFTDMQYGVGVQRRLLGPFWIGVYGTNKANVGATLGLSF